MKKFLKGFQVFAISLICGLLAWAEAGAATTQLNVGLYPYVPRVEQFKAALQSEWHKVQPQISLNFLTDTEWDGGYYTDPPAQVDVFVFDALYFEYFRTRNMLEPMQANEIVDLNDYLPYAVDGVRVGATYYAIPQLGCASLLIYDKRDTAMAAIGSLSDLKSNLNQCSYTSQIPPDRRGLMIDMSGGITDAALYIDATHSLDGRYPYPQPATPAEMNPASVANLKQVLNRGSYLNSTTAVGAYDFAKWFSNGWGRAYIGYSESMSQLTDEKRRHVAFKVLPFSDNPGSRPSFYADVIAVNPTVHARGNRALAVQLANVMAATATMVKSIGPDTAGGLPPQYLMGTRRSIFQALGQRYPLYTQMQTLIDTTHPVMFKLDADSRNWLSSMQDNIKTQILSNPVCGCDYPAARPIANNAHAPAICTTTCADSRGGWSGRWTNAYPAAQNGSVCGCNSCPETPSVKLRAVKGRAK